MSFKAETMPEVQITREALYLVCYCLENKRKLEYIQGLISQETGIYKRREEGRL